MISISPIEFDDLEPRLADEVRAKYERLGYLGDFFRYTAHQPDALRSFTAFTADARAGLTDNLAELIALTVASNLDNAYELVQHERLSVKLGMSKEWVAAAETLDPYGEAAAAELSDHERVVQRYLLIAVETMGGDAPPALEEMVNAIGVEAAVAVLFVMGRYVAHGVIAKSLELQAPVASIFAEDPSA